MLRILTMVVVTVLISSCMTSSELDYLTTNKDQSSIEVVPYNYKIKSGDLLFVQIKSLTPTQYDFFNQESSSYSQLMMSNPYLYGYQVDEDGNLSLPILGMMQVRGMTLSAIERKISQLSRKHFKDPSVKVNINNFNDTVLGEVNTPGRINIIEPKVNLLEVIGLAGDLREFANRKRIKVIRTTGKSPEIFYVNLKNSDITSSPAFYLQPYDVVYVEPLNKRFFAIKNLPSAISLIISSFTLYYLLQPN